MLTTSISKPRGTFQVYEDADNQFRWRITSVNGKIIGASSEGFSSKDYCIHNAELELLGILDFLKQSSSKRILPKKLSNILGQRTVNGILLRK